METVSQELQEAEQSLRPSPLTLRSLARRYGEQALGPAAAIEAEMVRRLARLAPPAASASACRRALHYLAVSSEITLAEARAFELGDLDAAKPLFAKNREINEREDSYWRQLGLPTCAAEGHDEGEFQSSASSA